MFYKQWTKLAQEKIKIKGIKQRRTIYKETNSPVTISINMPSTNSIYEFSVCMLFLKWMYNFPDWNSNWKNLLFNNILHFISFLLSHSYIKIRESKLRFLLREYFFMKTYFFIHTYVILHHSKIYYRER